MNFSLHKSVSTNYVFSFLLFLGLLIGFSRCVPIEDLVDPTVGEFSLQEQYNVSDTIILNAILADNFGISNYTVDIEAVNGEGLWSYTSIDSVKARLLNLKDTIIIPSENFAIGNYQLTLTAFDASGKSKITTKNFSVGKDASNPTFPTFDVLLPTLEPFTDGSYPACSSQKVPLAGKARDNIGLEFITAKFENYDAPYVIRTFINDKPRLVDLSTVFDNQLVFPPNLSSNAELILILKATDTEGNADSVKIPFKINCDNEKPLIGRIITNLNANRNEEGAVKVIQGQEFFIVSGQITDNEELNKVFVYLDNINTNTTETLIIEPIIGASFNFENLDSNLVIPIPPIPTIGENSYKLRIDATDAAGNRSDMYQQKLDIRPNSLPEPTVTYLKDSRNEYSSLSPLNVNNPLPILAGSVVTVRFKIVEDVALSNYKLVWQKENSSLQPFTITEKNEDITDFNPEVTFTVADNAEGIYTLTLFAKDTFEANPTVEVKYYFIVR